MRFVRLFIDPFNCLVGASELADTTEGASVEIVQPAVGTTLGSVKDGDYNTPAVGDFAFPENFIRAHLRTEIASLTPGLVDGEFHGGPVRIVLRSE
jgi:hypothetical protein